MPTASVLVKWLNEGKRKDGSPWYNIKDGDDTVYWSNAPIRGIDQGDVVDVTYTVNKNGSFQIVSYGAGGGEPATTKGNGGLRSAPGKPGAVGGQKDALISCLALLKQMLKPGETPTAEQAKAACDRAMSMYEYLRAITNKQGAEDMNDEIGF